MDNLTNLLIPKKYLEDLKLDTLTIQPFKKSILGKKFQSQYNDLLKKTLVNLDDRELKENLKDLRYDPIYEISDADRESAAYKIKSLKADFVLDSISDMYYNNYYVSGKFFDKFKDLASIELNRIELMHLNEFIELMKDIYTAENEIFRNKGLYEELSKRDSYLYNELDLLSKYIDAIF